MEEQNIVQTYDINISFFKEFFKNFIYLVLERGEENEKHQCVVASSTPPTVDWPATQACGLTGNQTGDPLVCRLALSPLSHTSQGLTFT